MKATRAGHPGARHTTPTFARIYDHFRAAPLTYDTRLGEAGFNAYDIAKLIGHANISTSQRYVRNLPVGAGEAVMLKNERRHSSTGPTLSERVRAL